VAATQRCSTLQSCRAAELAAIVPFQSTSVTDFKETFVDNTNKCQIQGARGAARMPSPGGLRYKPFDACLRTTSTLRPPTHPPPPLATTPSGPEPDPELTCGPKCRTADVNVISKRLCRWICVGLFSCPVIVESKGLPETEDFEQPEEGRVS